MNPITTNIDFQFTLLAGAYVLTQKPISFGGVYHLIVNKNTKTVKNVKACKKLKALKKLKTLKH